MWPLTRKTGRRLAASMGIAGAALAAAGFIGVGTAAASSWPPASEITITPTVPSLMYVVSVDTVLPTESVGRYALLNSDGVRVVDEGAGGDFIASVGAKCGTKVNVQNALVLYTTWTTVSTIQVPSCPSPTSTTTTTSPTTSPTTTTTSPPTTTTTTSPPTTTTTTSPPTTTKPAAGYDQGGDIETPRGPNMVLVAMGGALLLLAVVLARPRFVRHGRYGG